MRPILVFAAAMVLISTRCMGADQPRIGANNALVARGYLLLDASKKLRLAAVRHTGDIVADDAAEMIAEDAIHNLSDANFTIALPAIIAVNSALRSLASKFGYSADDAATFNNSFRNPVMSALTAERLFFILTNEGPQGVEREVRKLVASGIVPAAASAK